MMMQDQQGQSKPNEYDRFKDFTRRIVAVPKREADEAAKKLAAQKPERKKNDVPLAPFSEFKEAVRQVLSVSKEESDKQIAELQASNAAIRKAKNQKKRGAKGKTAE